MKYKAAMFDFDGTLTELGEYSPSQKVADALLKLSKKMPIAFCTGRQLESFERRGLSELLKEIALEERHDFLKNLFLFAENGSVGYFYDTDKNNFEEFYRANWPENFIQRKKFIKIVNKKIIGLGEVYENAHRVVAVFRTRLYDVEDRKIEDVYVLSKQIFDVIKEYLESIDPEYSKYLHVGNSGIGVIVCPVDGDKDMAIKKFSEYLREKRGINFDEKIREILVVGDMPEEGGNDYYFLNGRFGDPFTVGNIVENSEFPKPVINEDGRRLLNSSGTLYLINHIF